MVSILPGGNRTPWDVLGNLTGEKVQQVLPGAIEKGLERGQIQQGLKKIQDLTPQQLSQMQPHQLLASILGPFAGTRQGAQYAEAILPTLEKMMSRNQLFPGGGGGGSAEQQPSMYRGPQGQAGVGEASDQQGGMNFDQATKAAQAGNQAFQYQPPGQGTPQTDQAKTESPTLPPGTKPIQDMLQEAANSSDPFKVIDFWSKTNNIAKAQRDELYKEYLRNFETEENRINRENAFRGFAKGATGDKKYSDDEFNRLVRYSDKYASEPSQTNRLYFAEKDLQKYKNSISALEKARKAPGFFENLFRGQEQATKQLQSAFKPLVELGEIDEAKKISADLGFGPLQTERNVNPLPRASEGVINRIKKAPLSSIQSAPGILSISDKSSKERERAISKLPEVIKDAITLGGPMTSVKLIRNALFDKGYLEHEFAPALQEAIDKLGLKLSDYQKTEQSELGRKERRSFMDIWFSDDTLSPKEQAQRSFRGYE